MSYLVKNLEHNAVYEAIVQAKNKYGWNEVRKWFFGIGVSFKHPCKLPLDKRYPPVLHAKS